MRERITRKLAKQESLEARTEHAVKEFGVERERPISRPDILWSGQCVENLLHLLLPTHTQTHSHSSSVDAAGKAIC